MAATSRSEMRTAMSDESDALRDQVIDEILRAFADVAREDGVTLHEAAVIDDYGSADERTAARRLDTDRRWQDVPDRLIEEYSDTLSFVDVKGFRFYLPAYMVWTVRHLEDTGAVSAMHTILSLGLIGDAGLRGWQLERLGSFDEAQSRAICGFLRFMAGRESFEDGAARQALDAYWGRFCGA